MLGKRGVKRVPGQALMSLCHRTAATGMLCSAIGLPATIARLHLSKETLLRGAF